MNPIADLLGASVINGKKETVPVATICGNGKVVGLYFSAHWCPPCRHFTPELAKFYLKLKETRGDVLEIVFVSSDNNQSEADSYFAEMPWLALPYGDRQRKDSISKKYGITGIPTLILLDGATGKTINAKARQDVEADPNGTGFPWLK